MKKTSVIACLVLTIAAATSIRAHHSFSMFDASKEQVVVGDVVRWAFNSPHTVCICATRRARRGDSKARRFPRSWGGTRRSMASRSSPATASR